MDKKTDLFDVIQYVGNDFGKAQEIFESVKFKYGKYLNKLYIKELASGYGIHFTGEMTPDLAYEIRDFIRQKSGV